jgi:NitT/TauT family transport system ATP-binding protein
LLRPREKRIRVESQSLKSQQLKDKDMSATPPDRSPEATRIDVRGLSKSFQLAGTAIEAVRDVSFSVRRGEFVALLGPSGSGKSTILNMIATLIKPSSGQILIDGAPVVAGKATSGVGYVFQRDTLFPWRTVADNIGYGLQLAGVADAERKERVAACVAQAGLRGFEQAYPSALSGGMRQRAALMRTLVVEPQILLMDEPFGALDTHTKIDMHEVLLRIWEREQQTVLFVTHDLGAALTLADRIILFSARPGMIKDVFEVNFARPRDAVKVRETPDYAELFQHIWHSLGEEFVRGRRP